MQEFGGIPALGGRKYADFKGRYMGLPPKGHSSSDPIPFPLPEDAVRRPHFFYVQYLDGGPKWSKKCAELRETLIEKGKEAVIEWPKLSDKELRNPVGYDLTNGSESKISCIYFN